MRPYTGLVGFLGLFVLLSAPAAAQGAGERLAAAVTAGYRVSGATASAAVPDFVVDGLGPFDAAAARRAQEELWARLAAEGPLQPRDAAAREAPGLILRVTAVPGPLEYSWRLVRADTGELAGFGRVPAAAAPASPPPTPAAPAAGWSRRPLLNAGRLPPVYAGGGGMIFDGLYMPSVALALRDRREGWEAAFEYASVQLWATHAYSPSSPIGPSSVLERTRDRVASHQLRFTASRLLHMRKIAVPGIVIVETPWWVRLGAGYGFHATRARRYFYYRDTAATASYREEVVSRTHLGSFLVLQGAVGKRFGEVLELSGGIDYALGETGFYPTSFGFGVQPFARAAVRVF